MLKRAVASCLLLLSSAQSSIFFQAEKSEDSSICGETEEMHPGYINGLYYIFYEAKAPKLPADVPLVVWLSGGPGCSSLVGMLFENGPCMVGEDTPAKAIVNKYSWTKAANMLYIDQPRGTGFSPSKNALQSWSEETAMVDLVEFLQGFYYKYPNYSKNDLYIFGESYAGHYVPDLAYEIVERAISQAGQNVDSQLMKIRQNLKGIGIGNGLTSVHTIYETIGPYITTASSNLQFTAASKSIIDDCDNGINLCQDSSLGGGNDCSKVEICEDLMASIMSQIHQKGLNHYNIDVKCHADVFNLCYRFQPLYTFINSQTVLKKLGLPGQSWAPCSMDVFSHHLDKDWFEESEYKVAKILEQGIRVLVYAGDRDSVCNWMAQDLWTRTMVWPGQSEFQTQPFNSFIVQGEKKGEYRSAKGLTFLRVFGAGHMVPLDQPATALDMFGRFISNQTLG